MKVAAALAVVTVLVACSESTDPDEAGGWKKDALADGRVSFAMPGFAEYKESNDQGPDAYDEEKASCDYDSRHYSVSVFKGEALAKDMGTTEQKRSNWLTFFLVGIIQQEEDRSIEEEGKWTQGKLNGKWIRVALPPKRPQRTVPVYNWLYAAAWEDKAILVQFVAAQAAYDNTVYRGSLEKARERFVASVTVE